MPWFGCTWKKPLVQNARMTMTAIPTGTRPACPADPPPTISPMQQRNSTTNNTAMGMPDSEEALVSFMGVSDWANKRYHNDIFVQTEAKWSAQGGAGRKRSSVRTPMPSAVFAPRCGRAGRKGGFAMRKLGQQHDLSMRCRRFGGCF